MATENQEQTTTVTTNTTPSGTPSARNKAAVLAELESMASGTEKPKETLAESDAEEKPAEEVEAAAEETEETETDGDEESKDDERGLDRVRREEKRMRQEVAKEREEMSRELAKKDADHAAALSEAKEKLSKWDKLASRASYNPAAVLLELGVPKERLNQISQLIYLASPEGQADPKLKDHAARLAREMELDDRDRAREERLAKLEKELEEKAKTDKVEAAIGQFMDEVVKTVTSDTPLVHRLLEKSPSQARADLRQIAEIMADEHNRAGTRMNQADVAKMLERVMLAELEDAGVDTSQFTKAKPAAKSTTQEKSAAAKPAAVSTAKNGRAARADLIAKMESGDLT